MRKSPHLLVAMALCAAILIAVSFLIATETRDHGRAPDPVPFGRPG